MKRKYAVLFGAMCVSLLAACGKQGGGKRGQDGNTGDTGDTGDIGNAGDTGIIYTDN